MKRKTRGWLVSSEPDPWPALGQLSAPVFPSCAWPVAALGPRPLRWAWPVRVTGRGPGVGAGTVGRPIEAMAAVFCGGSCVPVAPLRLPWTASPRIPVGWHCSRGCLLPQLPSSPAPSAVSGPPCPPGPPRSASLSLSALRLPTPSLPPPSSASARFSKKPTNTHTHK